MSATSDEGNKLFDLHNMFAGTLWEKWVEVRDQNKTMEPTQFSRLSVVTLTGVAATVAVDVLMTEEQFIDVCRANFKEAYNRAPKFG